MLGYGPGRQSQWARRLGRPFISVRTLSPVLNFLQQKLEPTISRGESNMWGEFMRGVEKICGHCRATLLVGLHYCPGCLRPIDSRSLQSNIESSPSQNEADPYEDGPIDVDSMGSDLRLMWANAIYPLKAAIRHWRGQPQLMPPKPVPRQHGRDLSRFKNMEQMAKRSMVLSASYTRVVCPHCQFVQRRPHDLLPSDMITCERCQEEFPGSFAAEFRKGADLECMRCRTIIFSVGGLVNVDCPTCASEWILIRSRNRVKKRAILGTVGVTLLAGLVMALATNTTPQFVTGFVVIVIGSSLVFVTLVALGF